MVLENLLHTVTELRFTCSSLKNPIPRDKCQVKGKTALSRRMAILGRRQTHEPKNNPRVCSNLCPLSQWCYLIISSSATLFSCPQSFPVSESFPMSQLFISGGQSIGTSASVSVLPMNIHSWFPLRLTGLISLQSKGLSRVFSSTTVRKHQFFHAQPSLWPISHMCTWLKP